MWIVILLYIHAPFLLPSSLLYALSSFQRFELICQRWEILQVRKNFYIQLETSSKLLLAFNVLYTKLHLYLKLFKLIICWLAIYKKYSGSCTCTNKVHRANFAFTAGKWLGMEVEKHQQNTANFSDVLQNFFEIIFLFEYFAALLPLAKHTYSQTSAIQILTD